jgi:hypothetical protein
MGGHGLTAPILALALAAGCIAGCNGTHLRQPDHMALVRSGDVTKLERQGPVAARVLPYALIAEQAYQESVYQTKQPASIDRCDGAAPCIPADQADAVLRDWRIIYAETDPFLGCGNGSSGPCRPRLPGLGVQIWVRRGAVCEEAVIAYRGTVVKSLGNWVSNLHWATRFLPVSDQYHQVRRNAGSLVGVVRADPCFVEGRTSITAIGHSLGAGLAQHTTYVNSDVRRVYGFDPTIVTASMDPGLPDRKRHGQGLIIERIYEHGEVLAYPRYAMRHAFPPSACNPRIASIRFNLIHGNLISQHKLTTFTTSLLEEARDHRSEEQPLVEAACG